MVIRSRGETAMVTDIIQLRAQFVGPDGNPVDLDAFPTIRIIQPSGNAIFGPTSLGVFRDAVGLYGFDYEVPFNGPLGVWTDMWTGALNGFSVSSTFNFVIQNTQMPAINTDGYHHLGDDPGFNYTQNEIFNINKIK